MGLARSTYYDMPANQSIAEARLVERIKEICAEWPSYGYRRVTAELHANRLHPSPLRLQLALTPRSLRSSDFVGLRSQLREHTRSGLHAANLSGLLLAFSAAAALGCGLIVGLLFALTYGGRPGSSGRPRHRRHGKARHPQFAVPRALRSHAGSLRALHASVVRSATSRIFHDPPDRMGLGHCTEADGGRGQAARSACHSLQYLHIAHYFCNHYHCSPYIFLGKSRERLLRPGSWWQH